MACRSITSAQPVVVSKSSATGPVTASITGRNGAAVLVRTAHATSTAPKPTSLPPIDSETRSVSSVSASNCAGTPLSGAHRSSVTAPPHEALTNVPTPSSRATTFG